MKKTILISLASFLSLIVVTNAATILITNTSDTIGTFRTNVNTSIGNLNNAISSSSNALGNIASLASTTGNLIMGSSTEWRALTVGSNGKVLTASSTATGGLSWESTLSSLGSNYVSSTAAGVGISVSSATGEVTITNTRPHVTSTAVAPLSVSGNEISLGFTGNLRNNGGYLDTVRDISTTSTVTFATVTSTNALFTNATTTNFGFTTALPNGTASIGASGNRFSKIWLDDLDTTQATIGKLNVTSLAQSPFVVGGTGTSTIRGNGATSTFGGNVDLAQATSSYYIGGSLFGSSTSLGSGVLDSVLRSLDTITTGVWNGTAVATPYINTTFSTSTINTVIGTSTISNGNFRIGSSTYGIVFNDATIQATGYKLLAGATISAPSSTVDTAVVIGRPYSTSTAIEAWCAASGANVRVNFKNDGTTFASTTCTQAGNTSSSLLIVITNKKNITLTVTATDGYDTTSTISAAAYGSQTHP